MATVEPSVERTNGSEIPLVYSCSGCTSVAQLANDIAVWLTREGVAEMSCIAGVGGKVEELLAVASSGRQIIAIDGCSLACVKRILQEQGISPNHHIELSQLGFSKEQQESCSLVDTYRALDYVYQVIGINPEQRQNPLTRTPND